MSTLSYRNSYQLEIKKYLTVFFLCLGLKTPQKPGSFSEQKHVIFRKYYFCLTKLEEKFHGASRAMKRLKITYCFICHFCVTF
jgi:hypothetical protein